MRKNQLISNAGMSVLQVLVVTVTLFVLYRFLLETIGIAKLGIWSLVLASTSLTQIVNLGVSGGLVRYVAKYVALGEQHKVTGIIRIALWSIAGAGGVVLIAAYPLCTYVLSLVIPGGSLPDALAVLPHALLAVWLTLVSSVFQSSLDGIQRIDLRSLTLISGSLVNLFLCIALVGQLDLVGVAWARIGANLCMLAVSALVLMRCLGSLSFLSAGWNKSLFKEIAGYGARFQVMSVASMLYDPVTKSILSKFGSLELVGYYEMASRLVGQLRSVIVTANAAIVPVIAEQQENNPERVTSLYLSTYQVVFYLAVPAYALLIVTTPLISVIWLGHYQAAFAAFVTLLACGWLLNTLNAPAFFTYLGIGELGWNLISHIAIAVLNLVLGVVMAVQFGGVGAVIGWVCALAIGSSLIYLSFHIRNDIPLRELLPKSSRLLVWVCALGVGASVLLQLFVDSEARTTNHSALALGFSVLLLGSLWSHPLRAKLFALKSEFGVKKATAANSKPVHSRVDGEN